MQSALRISAVVPTLNEAAHIAACIESLRRGGVDEVLVVDGGSADSTLDLAGGLADRVLESSGGLWDQLNRGAREASGDALVFQYADGRFPAGGAEAVRRVLREPSAGGGAFKLRFASRASLYRVVAFCANLRNRAGFGPFGDQTLFVRAALFQELGGFNPSQALADFDLVRRVRRAARFCLLGECVESSVRCWEQNGRLRTLWAHWRLSAAYFLGRGRTRAESRRELDALRRVR
jgi:rSAM/selenodomain-associated transferase 2